MPKISIIIPFNNVEDYIKECLDSVLNQTLTDLEVILINDASKDNTRNIVQEYANNDPRIKIIDINERHGQGYARNRGIEIAQGEYIGFVDSDDFVNTSMFEIMYNRAKETDSDITMCQVSEYDDMNKEYSTSDYYSLSVLGKFADKIFSSEDTKEQILDINVALWNKIYKRDYLINTNEKFPEGFIYEDLPFFFGSYLPAKRISIVWKTLYNYRTNRKNSTMQQFNNKILDRPPMVALTYEKLKKTVYFNEIKQKIQGWIINDLFHRYTLLKENYHKEFFFLMKKTFQCLEIENIEDEYWKKIYHFQGYLLVMNNTFEEFSKKVFNKYLDFHEMENRLKSELISSADLDKRCNLIYNDLNNIYKYSEKLNKETIINIHNEISKSYDYINLQITKLEAKLSNINGNNIQPQNVNQINSEDFNEKINLLYNDIKDLSYIVNNYHNEFKTIQNDIENRQENIVNQIKSFQQELSSSKTEYNEIINNNRNEFKENIAEVKTEFYKETDRINKVINNTEEEFKNNKQEYNELIARIKDEFLSSSKQIEELHKKEIINLQAEIKELENTLRQEMKSPFKKFIEKYSNNKTKG